LGQVETRAFYVYILRYSDGNYYTGHTDNLEKRMAEHQSGEYGGYASTRLPVQLRWSQDCATRLEALSAEQQIKGWSRKKKRGHDARGLESRAANRMGNEQSVAGRIAVISSVHPSIPQDGRLFLPLVVTIRKAHGKVRQAYRTTTDVSKDERSRYGTLLP
jgi:predicted GIY-YIG superfamily endonuclease